MTKKEVVVQETPAYTTEMIETIKNTVAKDATNDELRMFITLAQKYDLDPFAKEIWFIKMNGRPTIITSRDGYLKVAQKSPTYLGIISFPVHENDTFEIDAAMYSVSHKLNVKDPGKIIGAWAKVEDSTKKPVICFVKFAEYVGSSSIWRQYPSAMIQKVAESFALKRMYGINGLVTQEELSAQEQPLVQRTQEGKFVAEAVEEKRSVEDLHNDTAPIIAVTTAEQEAQFEDVHSAKKSLSRMNVVVVDQKLISKQQYDAIKKLWGEICFLDPALKDVNHEEMFVKMIQKHTGKKNVENLINPEANTVITRMTNYLAKLSQTPAPVEVQAESTPDTNPFTE